MATTGLATATTATMATTATAGLDAATVGLDALTMAATATATAIITSTPTTVTATTTTSTTTATATAVAATNTTIAYATESTAVAAIVAGRGFIQLVKQQLGLASARESSFSRFCVVQLPPFILVANVRPVMATAMYSTKAYNCTETKLLLLV